MSMPGVPLEQGDVPVRIQDQNSELVNLYLHRIDATPSITAPVSVGDTTINIDTNAGLVNGEALTIYEGLRHSQCIIKSSTATSVTVTPPVDFEYTTGATVEAGSWNMAVNGSVTPQTFCIHAPPLQKFDIYELRFSFLDGTRMDPNLFGGIAALTNGIIVRYDDGYTKNLGVIVNNAGFIEQGFKTKYDDRASGLGLYAYTGTANGPVSYGVAPRLNGATTDKFCIVVQDDLTALTNLNFTIGGHVVED